MSAANPAATAAVLRIRASCGERFIGSPGGRITAARPDDRLRAEGDPHTSETAQEPI
jgi:hypothetical protein